MPIIAYVRKLSLLREPAVDVYVNSKQRVVHTYIHHLFYNADLKNGSLEMADVDLQINVDK